MRTYLIVLAKMRRPSTTPSARMPRSLSSRTTAAASLATSAAESTEMPTSASWSAIASLTPSPRKPTSAPRLRCARMMRDFCSGRDAGEDRRLRQQRDEGGVVELRRARCPVTTVPGSRPTSRQRCAATWPLSPVTILTVIAEPGEPGERLLDVGLGRVGEAEEARRGRGRARRLVEVVGVERAACDGDDSRARGEEAVEGRLRLGGDGRAAGEDGFRGALGDQQPALSACRRGPRPAAARGRRAGGRAASERRRRGWPAVRPRARGRARCRSCRCRPGRARARGRPACPCSRAPA